MLQTKNHPSCVIIVAQNNRSHIKDCLDSLLKQSLAGDIFVIDNGSADGTRELLQDNYPNVRLIVNQKDIGLARGANAGIKQAIDEGYEYIGLMSSTASPGPDWLKQLTAAMHSNDHIGIVTSRIVSADKVHLESTGELYSIWGLPYSRDYGENVTDSDKTETTVFGASASASLYRSKMLNQIGMFDDDFVARYVDVDISFRAQLADWKVIYQPKALVYQHIDSDQTSKGFMAYHQVKNLPWLVIKNVPQQYMATVLPRFLLAYTLLVGRRILGGHGIAAIKGVLASIEKLPQKVRERRQTQHTKPVTNEYIWQLIIHDLPPTSISLRKLRSVYWRLQGKS